jgi:hypothetical protein
VQRRREEGICKGGGEGSCARESICKREAAANDGDTRRRQVRRNTRSERDHCCEQRGYQKPQVRREHGRNTETPRPETPSRRDIMGGGFFFRLSPQEAPACDTHRRSVAEKQIPRPTVHATRLAFLRAAAPPTLCRHGKHDRGSRSPTARRWSERARRRGEADGGPQCRGGRTATLCAR